MYVGDDASGDWEQLCHIFAHQWVYRIDAEHERQVDDLWLGRDLHLGSSIMYQHIFEHQILPSFTCLIRLSFIIGLHAVLLNGTGGKSDNNMGCITVISTKPHIAELYFIPNNRSHKYTLIEYISVTVIRIIFMNSQHSQLFAELYLLKKLFTLIETRTVIICTVTVHCGLSKGSWFFDCLSN